MSKILISGATGFIGKPLTSMLQNEGHEVVGLSRKAQPGSIQWDPLKKQANPSDFEGFDAVINLSGEPLTAGRWTEEKKRRIYQSRVEGTAFLVTLLAGTHAMPKTFISASATGFYGNRGEEEMTEKSSAGTGFLAHVADSWEKASLSLRDKGVRVVHTRFGVVLGKDGGFLEKLIPLYKLGLGTILGDGSQWLSWVHRDDLIKALAFILSDPELSGPINICSPNPVRQEVFSKALAEALNRPHFLKIPAWALRLILGESADEMILSSAKTMPAKLLATNFAFTYAKLHDALKSCL